MKKTFTANLNGTVFHIEEDAYDALQRYLANIRAKFSGSAEAGEIMADIEARIAELFTERLQGRQAVSMADVDHVKQVMGQPEDYVDGEDAGGGSFRAEDGTGGAPRKHKRLYRDPEDKKLAGVLSGLGHYFGIDPLWLRIAFLVFVLAGWGFPAIFYIALWVLVPEALSAAEKLEMQGEAVTVDNIKRMFEEGAERVKAGAGKVAGEARDMGRKYWAQGSNYRHEARYQAQSAGHQAIHVFGKLVGLALLVVAVSLLLGLFVGIIGGSVGLWQSTWSSENIGFLDLGGHLFNTRYHALWFGIGMLLLVTIPIIAMFLAGFRLLMDTPAPKWMGWTLSSLWVLALIPVIWTGLALAKDFGRENSVRTELAIAQPAQGTIDLDMLAPADSNASGWSIYYKHGRLDMDMGGIHLDHGDISGAWGEVDIEQSTDSLFHLLVIRTARASSAKAAAARAERVSFAYKQEGDVLFLSPVVSFRANDKIRAQDVKFILQVPYGRSVFLREASRPMLDDIANTTNTYDGDMVNHLWTMTPQGLSMGNGIPASKDSTGTPHAPAPPPLPAKRPKRPAGSAAGRSEKEPVGTAAVTSARMPNLFGLLTQWLRP